jgi:hypothetical protein
MKRRDFMTLCGAALVFPCLPRYHFIAGDFICDGKHVIIPLDFEPDVFKLYITGKNQFAHEWFSVEGCPPSIQKGVNNIRIPGVMLPKGSKAKFFAIGA